MMISFCRKSVHSFLGFAAAADSLQPKSPWKSHHVNAAAEDGLLPNGLGLAGLGLITAVCSEDVMQRSPNVLESSSVKSASPPPSPLPPPKKDPGGIGFIDDIGGGVDGLMSCTESLGFESSDERLVNDASQMLEDNTEGFGYGGGGGGGRCSVRGRRRRVVVKKFPPPLSSLNQHGHPNFYLRPVRKDGRLELTEIRIERPEILRASREDGRLRLHLIKDDEQDKNENHHEEEEEEAEEEAITEEPEEESITEEPEEEEEEEEEVESFVNEGKMGNNPVNGEGYRRCIEVVNHQRRREHHHHHHHHMDVWRQHCVTTS